MSTKSCRALILVIVIGAVIAYELSHTDESPQQSASAFEKTSAARAQLDKEAQPAPDVPPPVNSAPELTPAAPDPPPPPKPPERKSATENPSLSIAFNVTDSGSLQIDNQDDFDWKECRAAINTKTFTFQGYRASVARIAAHQSAYMPLGNFVSGDGERFDPRTHEVLNAYIQCLTPNGYQSALRKSAQDQ